LIVGLDASHQDEVTLPDSVTIADGQTTSEPFAIVAIDDALPDGTQSVTITAVASGYAAGSAVVQVTDSETAGSAWQNAADPYDLDGQDGATAVDVLLLLLYLNSNPGDPSLPPPTASPPPYYDVDGDGFCTATDLLELIIHINSKASGGGEAEPAAVPDSAPLPGLPAQDRAAILQVHRDFAAMRFLSEEIMVFSSHRELVHHETSRWPPLPGHWREYARTRDGFWELVDESDVLNDLLVDTVTSTD
jgi:hypothetical protein